MIKFKEHALELLASAENSNDRARKLMLLDKHEEAKK